MRFTGSRCVASGIANGPLFAAGLPDRGDVRGNRFAREVVGTAHAATWSLPSPLPTKKLERLSLTVLALAVCVSVSPKGIPASDTPARPPPLSRLRNLNLTPHSTDPSSCAITHRKRAADLLSPPRTLSLTSPLPRGGAIKQRPNQPLFASL